MKQKARFYGNVPPEYELEEIRQNFLNRWKFW